MQDDDHDGRARDHDGRAHDHDGCGHHVAGARWKSLLGPLSGGIDDDQSE
jgi:hypothetical protein